ncbi:MAG: GntR family transcriptional regulator [Ruminococcaceae bacterium]|nr:GntR family transcriptional regulator [Oscillospiraceae bacterium]
MPLQENSNFTFQKRQKKSLADFAYDSIKQAIIRGDIAPGERLREAEIASQMDISRGPVREAFNRLAQEGLLFSHPYRETVVAETSIDVSENVLVPIRRIIENFVSSRADQYLDENDYEYLQSLISEMQHSCETENLDALTDLDMQFHTYIVQCTNDLTINAVWNSIISKIHTRLLYQGIQHDRLSKVVDEHQEYLKLMQSQDKQQLENHLNKHIY